MGYPLGFDRLFPERGRTGSLLSPAYNIEETELSVSNYFPVTYIFSKIHLWTKCSLGRSQKLVHPVVIIIYTVPVQQKM